MNKTELNEDKLSNQDNNLSEIVDETKEDYKEIEEFLSRPDIKPGDKIPGFPLRYGGKVNLDKKGPLTYKETIRIDRYE